MSSANRNKIKKWFITFPHSGDYTPETFTLKLFTKACIICACGVPETHDDGITPHIHVNIHLKYGLTKSQFLGKIKRIYPNDYMRIDIRSTRQNPAKAREGYLSKECPLELVWYYQNNNELDLAKKKKRLLEYNICAMTFGEDVWGLINIDATISLWNINIPVRENLVNGNVIWTIEPTDPWWVIDLNQL